MATIVWTYQIFFYFFFTIYMNGTQARAKYFYVLVNTTKYFVGEVTENMSYSYSLELGNVYRVYKRGEWTKWENYTSVTLKSHTNQYIWENDSELFLNLPG